MRKLRAASAILGAHTVHVRFHSFTPLHTCCVQIKYRTENISHRKNNVFERCG